MKGKLQHIVINYLAKHLIKAVSEDDILRITSTGYMAGKRKLERDEINLLREEANAWRESLIWDYMKKEVEWIAFVRGRKATSEKDTYASNAMYYNLDLMQKFLDNLSK